MKIKIYSVWAVIVFSSAALLLAIYYEFNQEFFHLDWTFLLNGISSISTLGTLIVALMAYFAVPKWIHQKADEVSFTLANELICITLPDIITSLELITSPFNFLENNYYAPSKTSFNDLQKDIERHRDEIWELNKKVRKVENTLLILRRQGWNLKSHQKKLSDDFLHKFSFVFSSYLGGTTKIKSLKFPDIHADDKINSDNIAYHKKLIFDTREMVMHQTESFLVKLNEFLDSEVKVENFFTRNTK